MNGTAVRQVPFTEEVELYCWDKKRTVQAVEISPLGLTLLSQEPLAEGSLVTLRLKLPEARAFTILGRVLRSEPRDGVPGQVEIDFVDIAPSDRANIAAFVQGRKAA